MCGPAVPEFDAGQRVQGPGWRAGGPRRSCRGGDRGRGGGPGPGSPGHHGGGGTVLSHSQGAPRSSASRDPKRPGLWHQGGPWVAAAVVGCFRSLGSGRPGTDPGCLGTRPAQGRGPGRPLQRHSSAAVAGEQIQLFSGRVAAGGKRQAAGAPSTDATVGGSRHGAVAQGGCPAPGQFRGAPSVAPVGTATGSSVCLREEHAGDQACGVRGHKLPWG